MALENEEELQRLMEDLRRSFGDLADSTNKLTPAQEKLKAKVDLTVKALGAVGGFAKTVGEGNTEFKAMNGVIDTVTGALAGMAKVLPVFGDAVGAAIKGVGESAKFVIEQLDQTYKAFEQLGDVGALGAKGMSGLNEQFIRSGMSLQGFTKAVTANSTTLAKFAGSAYDGAERFSKIVGDIATTNAGDELRRLGIGADKIGETAASFLQRETRLGRAQAMTQEQLTSGTIKYAKELDELSKLTGQSKDALQKQQDAALSEARFRATTQKMINEGLDPAALINFQSQVSSIAPAIGQGVRDLATGNATTDAAKQLLASTGGTAGAVIDQLKRGLIGPAEASKLLQKAYKENETAILDHAEAIGNDSGVYTDAAQSVDFMKAQVLENGKLIKGTQKAQTEGADELTNQTVDAKKALELMSRNISALGMKLLPSAATAVEGFTTALNKFIGFVAEKLGIDIPGAKSGAAAAKANNVAASQGSTADMLNAGAEAQLTPAEQAAYAKKQGAAGSYAGLRIKGGAEGQATAGGQANPKLIEVANLIQEKLGGTLHHFTGFNDKFHMDRNSKHNQGTALDFTITDPSMAAEVAAMVKGIPGVSNVLDEYNKPSAGATGGHIHAEVSARNGFSGMLSGPTSGYRPNLTMHGTESISIRPTMSGDTSSTTSDIGIMSKQLDRLEELVSVMKSQVALTNRIVQLQS